MQQLKVDAENSMWDEYHGCQYLHKQSIECYTGRAFANSLPGDGLQPAWCSTNMQVEFSLNTKMGISYWTRKQYQSKSKRLQQIIST